MAKYILFVMAIVLVAVTVSAQVPGNSDNSEVSQEKSCNSAYKWKYCTRAQWVLEKVFCTKEWNPVCASDGKTYGNKCEFENAKKIKQELTFQTGACDDMKQ